MVDPALEEQLAQSNLTRHLFRRLAALARPYRRRYILNLIFTFLATLSQLLGPKFIQIGIDRYLTENAVVSVARRGILIVSVIYLGNLLIGWFLSVAQVRSAVAVGQSIMNDLRLAVFEHIQRLSMSFFDRTHQGRIISRADTDIDALDRVLTWGANQLLSSVLTLGGALALMASYDWRLCLAVSGVLPALFLATRLFQRHGMRAYRKVREQGSRLTGALAEGIAGVRVSQAFVREDFNLSRFQELQSVYTGRFLAAARVFHTYMPFVGLVSGLGTAIILGYGGSLALRGEITVGELAAFVLYLSMFFGPIHTMGDLFNALLSASASAERIFHLIDTPPQVTDRPDATDLAGCRGKVQFENVWFHYDTTAPGAWVLEDINFSVEPGQTIALVGATGSGKTSIVSLLLRFYEPQRGDIRVDGTSLKDLTLESLHRQVGIVTQDNFLFTGTVMENLKFGRPQATDDEVRFAARMLGTEAVIDRFNEGYQTKVAERGANFSVGERQLLCITRAMVAQPRLLILDEATSAVDPRTEGAIQRALTQLFAERTSFVIAHRLSTVRHASQILVLHQGRIVERGTHEELLAHSGRYSELYREFVEHGLSPSTASE